MIKQVILFPFNKRRIWKFLHISYPMWNIAGHWSCQERKNFFLFLTRSNVVSFLCYMSRAQHTRIPCSTQSSRFLGSLLCCGWTVEQKCTISQSKDENPLNFVSNSALAYLPLWYKNMSNMQSSLIYRKNWIMSSNIVEYFMIQ